MAYKIVDAETLDAGLTTVADAIRDRANAHLPEAEVTEALVFPDGMAEAVGAIPDTLRMRITDTLTHFVDNESTKMVSEYCLNKLSNLESVTMQNVGNISYYSLASCPNLNHVDIPKVTNIGTGAFQNADALVRLDLPSVTHINGNAFWDSGLRVLSLRAQRIVTLANTSAFTLSPFASGKAGGILLVPSAYVESYTTASNWSAIWGYGHNRFLALEDFTLDGTITGELDWDKINAELEDMDA